MNCTIAQFYPYDANRGAALRFGNSPEHPLYNFNCYNSLVTGYADDVVMSEADTTTNYAFFFDHCILRTPAVDDSVNIKDVIWENPEDTLGTGEKHFRLIDIDLIKYDFRLDSMSIAIGKAVPNPDLPFDRLGVRRDDEPDIGCYEYVKE